MNIKNSVIPKASAASLEFCRMSPMDSHMAGPINSKLSEHVVGYLEIVLGRKKLYLLTLTLGQFSWAALYCLPQTFALVLCHSLWGYVTILVTLLLDYYCVLKCNVWLPGWRQRFFSIALAPSFRLTIPVLIIVFQYAAQRCFSASPQYLI